MACDLNVLFIQGCSFVTLNHEDIYSSANTLQLILQTEYLADVIIKAEPLATGLASDVHGQVHLYYLLSSPLYKLFILCHHVSSTRVRENQEGYSFAFQPRIVIYCLTFVLLFFPLFGYSLSKKERKKKIQWLHLSKMRWEFVF